MPLQRRHCATVLISIFFCLSCQTGTRIFHLLPLMSSYCRPLGRRSHQLLEVRSSLFRCSCECWEDAVSSLANGWPFERGSWDKSKIFTQLLVTLFHIRVNAPEFLGWGRIATNGLVKVSKASIVTGVYAAIYLQDASILTVWWYSSVWSKYQFSLVSVYHSQVFTYWWAQWNAWPRINQNV